MPRPEEDAAAHVDAPVRRPLRVEDHEVVHGDAVAEAHLVRVAQHDALAEDDALPHRAEEERVEELAQEEAERSRNPGAREHHRLVEHEAPEAPAAHHQVLVLPQGRGTPAHGFLDADLPPKRPRARLHSLCAAPLRFCASAERTVAWRLSS